MSTYQVKCVKCAEIYTSDEDEGYLCSSCLTVKNKIAQEIDKKFANIPKVVTETAYQKYDRITKERGSRFVNAKDIL